MDVYRFPLGQLLPPGTQFIQRDMKEPFDVAHARSLGVRTSKSVTLPSLGNWSTSCQWERLDFSGQYVFNGEPRHVHRVHFAEE